MSLSESEFLEKCAEFGVKIPTPPGSAPMTGAEIIAAINGTLGYDYWINGVSSAIFVNDLSAGSAELAAYVNVDGQWEIPSNSIIVINTNTQSAESVIGRTFLLKGRTYIVPSVGGGSKGITQVNGVGLGNCIFLNDTSHDGGSIIVGDVALLSNDPVRTIYSLETPFSLFSLTATIMGGFLLGPVNANEIQINAELCIAISSGGAMLVGNECNRFTLNNINADLSAPVNCMEGFSFTPPPISGLRNIYANNVKTSSDISSAFFIIGDDSGENRGVFTNCLQGSGVFITSLTSSVFNTNPYFSPNFYFDVINYGRTQRIGEEYFNGVHAIPLTVNAWTNLSAAPIDDSGLSNGLVATENPGELLYLLPQPSFVTVTYEVEGSAGNVDDVLYLGAFYQPNVGVYAQVIKSGDSVERRMEPPNPSTYVTTSLTYTLRMQAGDRIKPMIKNVIRSNTFTLNICYVAAQVVAS